MTSKYQHIFIDLDDTLWDFHGNAKEALNEVFEQEELEKYFPSFECFLQIYAKNNKLLWEKYGRGEVTKDFLGRERFRYPLSTVGITNDKLADRMNKKFLNILPAKKKLMPYAIDFLEFLKKGKKTITLISNGFVEVQNKKVKSSGLEKFFDYIVLSELAGALKPNKKIFDYALKLNNAKAHEAVMIGDNYMADVLGAIDYGIDAIYLNNNGEKRTDLPNKVKEINSLKEAF